MIKKILPFIQTNYCSITLLAIALTTPKLPAITSQTTRKWRRAWPQVTTQTVPIPQPVQSSQTNHPQPVLPITRTNHQQAITLPYLLRISRQKQPMAASNRTSHQQSVFKLISRIVLLIRFALKATTRTQRIGLKIVKDFAKRVSCFTHALVAATLRGLADWILGVCSLGFVARSNSNKLWKRIFFFFFI